jgi:hypothetical protein
MSQRQYTAADMEPAVNLLKGTDLTRLFAWQNGTRVPALILKTTDNHQGPPLLTVPLDALDALCTAIREQAESIPGAAEFITRIQRSGNALRVTLDNSRN